MITEERLPHFCETLGNSSNLLFSPQKEKLKEYRSSSSVICHLDFCLSLITFRHSPFVRKIHNRRSFSYQLNKNNIKTFFELFFFQLTCSCACLMPLFFYFFFFTFYSFYCFFFFFFATYTWVPCVVSFVPSFIQSCFPFRVYLLSSYIFYSFILFILLYFLFSFIFFFISFLSSFLFAVTFMFLSSFFFLTPVPFSFLYTNFLLPTSFLFFVFSPYFFFTLVFTRIFSIWLTFKSEHQLPSNGISTF